MSWLIHGSVVDRGGGPVGGLRVEIVNNVGEETLGEASTTADGAFQVEFDPPSPEIDPLLARRPIPIRIVPFARAFRGEELVAQARIVMSGTRGEVVLAFGAAPATTESTEVVLHELGETVATTVARVQAELDQYPSGLGAYVVDEVHVSIPLRMRVDELGQVRATVVADAGATGPGIGQLELRVRPVLGARQPPPVVSGQSIASLGTLPPGALEKLAEQRIFSVDDLLVAARKPGARAALEELGVPDLDATIERARFVSMSVIPAAVTAELAAAGVGTAAQFVKRSPKPLARLLTRKLDQPIDAGAVEAWQADVKAALEVPLPPKVRKGA